MVILGIDPGSCLVGYSVLKKHPDKKLEVLDFGCVSADEFPDCGKRLEKIYGGIKKLIDKYKPDIVSVETLFFFKNVKTVMPVSQTKGVILLAAEQKKIPVLEFTPLQMKMAIAGYGLAQKKQVIEMIKKTVDLSKFDLKKNYRKKDDAFDAIGIAICASLVENVLLTRNFKKI